MKAELLVKELAQLAGKAGIKVIFDTGNFRGGACEVKHHAYLVLNKRHPAELHLGLLADALRHVSLDEAALRPVIRKTLTELWAKRPTSVDEIALEPTDG